MLGPGPLTIRDQVAAIAAAIGEPVRLEQIDVDTYRAELRPYLPEPVIDLLFAAGGSVLPLPADVATDAVPELLGRPALTFAAWAREHADDFR